MSYTFPRMVRGALAALLALATPATLCAQDGVVKKWAIAEFGKPSYADGIDHFPYANPDAPKGGKIVLSDFGSFDTLNLGITYINPQKKHLTFHSCLPQNPRIQQ